MANCSDNTYIVKNTDTTQGSNIVAKSALITDEFDIALIGKTRLEYGEIFNENCLHIAENFACPEDAGNPGNPDLARAFGLLLENPTQGQTWYNSSQIRPFVYDGTQWVGLGTMDDVAGNYGVIAHGQPLPQPMSQITGYVFPYAECTWIVTPFNYSGEIDFMRCLTDANGIVTMQYRVRGTTTIIDGLANYQIIGVRGNSSIGTVPTPPALP